MSTSKPRAQGCTLVEAEGGGTVRSGDGRGRGLMSLVRTEPQAHLTSTFSPEVWASECRGFSRW